MPLRNEYIISEFNDDELVIKLFGIKNVTNMSNMFYECASLIKIPDFPEWNTCKVNNMSNLFYGCRSLTSLPDISNWTINLKNKYMFYDCFNLLNIPLKFKDCTKKRPPGPLFSNLDD